MTTKNNNGVFLKPKGNYRNLIVFQKTECIYDITYYFAHKYFAKGDRTIDQMVQAARSGKQNIAEGAAASVTSTETEIKLMNVARASLQELLLDYEDYLRVRNLRQWESDSVEFVRAQELGKEHNDSAFWRELIATRNAETVANLAIILLHQCDYLLYRYILKVSERFINEGGFREKLNQERRIVRSKK